MHAAKTWWRGLSGLLAAAVIAVLAFGPSLDALICGGEGLPATASPAAEARVQSADLADHRSDAPGHVDGGACAHGHCHHGAASEPAREPPLLQVSALAARLPIPLTAVPISGPRYSLDRPPRA